MVTRAQTISLTASVAGFSLFVALWAFLRVATPADATAGEARWLVEIRREFPVHNITDPNPARTVRVELRGSFVWVGETPCATEEFTRRLREEARYATTDVVLAKVDDETPWGEIESLRRGCVAAGRDAVFAVSEAPCECDERDPVVHRGARDFSASVATGAVRRRP